jgi:hypothetical protein
MTTYQTDLFGGETAVTGDHTTEARRVLQMYPQIIDNPGHFLFLVAKNRYPWLGGISEQQRNDLRQFFRETQSLDRRRQEHREKGIPPFSNLPS